MSQRMPHPGEMEPATDHPRHCEARQGREPRARLIGCAQQQSSKTARPVADFRSAYRAWPGANSSLMGFANHEAS